MTDEPTPEDLEQLARSVAMSGVLGDRDRLDVDAALRRLADIDKAVRRHPTHTFIDTPTALSVPAKRSVLTMARRALNAGVVKGHDAVLPFHRADLRSSCDNYGPERSALCRSTCEVWDV